MRLQGHLKSLLVVCLFPLTIYALNSDTTEWKLKISVEKANIRLEPNVESPVVSTVLKGTILDSYEKVGEWFRVVVGPDEKGFSIIGFIHSSDVDIIEEKTTKEPDFWEEEPEFFEGIGLRVKLSGGLDYFYSGDIEKGARGMYDSTAYFFSSGGYTLEQGTESCHTGFDVSGDIIFYVKPQVGIGIGGGYMQATGTNYLNVSGKDIPWMHQFGGSRRITTVPIRLGLFFILPVHRLFSITFNGGTSLYMTNYSYALARAWKDMKSIFHKANAKGLGFHGGIGLEVNLTQRVAFFIEGQGRYAKISNFKGKATETEYVVSKSYVGYVSSEEKGTLYYLEDENFPSLVIRNNEPSGFKTIRKATFDFSGFSLRAGVIIKF